MSPLDKALLCLCTKKPSALLSVLLKSRSNTLKGHQRERLRQARKLALCCSSAPSRPSGLWQNLSLTRDGIWESGSELPSSHMEKISTQSFTHRDGLSSLLCGAWVVASGRDLVVETL